jgi:hypothetical protein|tara:strand:- start:50 stop:268 length:219 start_codon:yes stop_codon:yes gene_type:complete
MTFKLVHKGNDEAIDTVTISEKIAKNYFMKRKNLSEKEFDKIFEVKKIADMKQPIKYDWWEEESTGLDIEKG